MLIYLLFCVPPWECRKGIFGLQMINWESIGSDWGEKRRTEQQIIPSHFLHRSGGVCVVVWGCNSRLEMFCFAIFFLYAELLYTASSPTIERVSSFTSMEVQGPYHLFNTLYLIRYRCSWFCFKSISPSPIWEGNEMKQLQKKGSVNKQTAENIVGFPQLP